MDAIIVPTSCGSRGVVVLLVIIGDLYAIGMSVKPSEANTKLIVYPDAVLPFAVTLQRFQLIARRNLECIQAQRGVEIFQLTTCRCLKVDEFRNADPVKKGFRVFVGEGLDHGMYCISIHETAQAIKKRRETPAHHITHAFHAA